MYKRDGEVFYEGLDEPDINTIDLPDLSDFYNQVSKYRDVISLKAAMLPYESSRGCWYGEKKQCKFCALFPEGKAKIHFRCKDPEIARKQILYLKETWRDVHIRFHLVDAILNKDYIRTLMPDLVGCDLRFECEIKPNLKPDEIKACKEAGFTRLILGIEAFHPGFLKLLDKGQAVLTCINTLKWCKYYDIHREYNLLYDVPFEKAEWYSLQFEVLKKIAHLGLPKRFQPVGILRFSVYTEEKLLLGMKPHSDYDYLYPDYMNKENIAYRYVYDHSIVAPPSTRQPMVEWLSQQNNRSFVRFEGQKVIDGRTETSSTFDLSDREYKLLRACSVPVAQRIVNSCFAPEDIEPMIEKGLLLAMEGKYLSLVEIDEEDVCALHL
jgi:radical SAM superfamily enzyme YgiQ (UPF0313 family)